MSDSSSRLATVGGVGTSVGGSACNPAVTSRRETVPVAATETIDAETFMSLEALARKAADDSMGVKGAPRDGIGEDQFDALACDLLRIGIRAFHAFDRELTVSAGDAFNHAYRSMRGYRGGSFTEGPYIDWLRTNIRDDRFEPKASTSVTATGELPDGAVTPHQSFDELVSEVSARLSTRSLDALYRFGRPIVEDGMRVREVAEEHDVAPEYVRGRLAELGRELGVAPDADAADLDVELGEVLTWTTTEVAV